MSANNNFSVSSIDTFFAFLFANKNRKTFLMHIAVFHVGEGFLIPYVPGLPLGENSLPGKGALLEKRAASQMPLS